jgi:hypothetical protein
MCHPEPVLRQMRAQHGGPHLGTRLLALILIALLAFPITFWIWRGVSAVLGALL